MKIFPGTKTHSRDGYGPYDDYDYNKQRKAKLGDVIAISKSETRSITHSLVRFPDPLTDRGRCQEMLSHLIKKVELSVHESCIESEKGSKVITEIPETDCPLNYWQTFHVHSIA